MGRLMEHWEMTLKKHKTLEPHGHYKGRVKTVQSMLVADKLFVVMEVDGEAIPLASESNGHPSRLYHTIYGTSRVLYSDKREMLMLEVLHPNYKITRPAEMFPLRKCAEKTPAPKLKWKSLVEHWEDLMEDAKFYLIHGPEPRLDDKGKDLTRINCHRHADFTWQKDYGALVSAMWKPQPIEVFGDVMMEISLTEEGYIPLKIEIPLFHDAKKDILTQEMVNRMKWKGHTTMLETMTATPMPGVSQ